MSWQSTASGLEDEYIHAAALSWLVGDEDAVEICLLYTSPSPRDA